MTDYKLTYFDVDGGRAEPVRIAFHIAGIPFEDKRISYQEFGEIFPTMRFHSVPVLEIDGAQVTQSDAQSRYIGKMAGLYPTDDLQALYCDEVLGALEDLTHYIVQTFGLQDEELQEARQGLVDGWLPIFLKGLDGLVTRGGGKYFADNQLTIADISSSVVVSWLCSGQLEHVPADIVQKLAPGLVEHHKRVAADPRVVAYYASRKA